MKLLTIGNTKTMKGETKGFLTFILHLAPFWQSGYNACPMASEGCAAACLNTAGLGGIIKVGETTNDIQEARVRKTKMFFEQRDEFMTQLVKDIKSAIKMAEKRNYTPVFRLNGTSDIRWENVPVAGFDNVMTMFPNIRFYDYTKIPNRRDIPSNYHLTFSRSESNENHVLTALQNNMNVAVVFRRGGPKVKKVYTLEQRLAAKAKRAAAPKKPKTKKVSNPRKIDLSWVPETYLGVPTFNGDDNDLRFLDPKNVVVSLIAKGEAKYDTSGFIVDIFSN
jgi:hypothetical protein